MSDLELAKVKLIDTIGKYNLTASNIAKFKLSQLEENLFATMMVEFAQELANDDNKENANCAIFDVSQQRELLREFMMWYEEPSIVDIKATDETVDKFLSRNSG